MKKETKLCKYCKTEIPGDAKICPQCRKKQGMGLLPKAAIVVVVLGIIGAVGGSGSNSDKTETVAESSAVETAAETEALAENVVEDSSAEEATANVPKEYISALKSSENLFFHDAYVQTGYL